jgi:hypothetical protein
MCASAPPPNLALIEHHLSPARLGPYIAEAGSVEQALQLYQWNAAISAALFELIGYSEVILRNALTTQLSQLRINAGDPTGEWFTITRWFQPSWTTPMIDSITRARRSAQQASGVVTEGKMVAELTFGFWRFLLTARYEASLWTPALRHAFTSGLSRRTVHDTVEHINMLRNRIAHHEPIFQRPLADDLAAITTLLHWISPPAADWAIAATSQRLDPLMNSRP